MSEVFALALVEKGHLNFIDEIAEVDIGYD